MFCLRRFVPQSTYNTILTNLQHKMLTNNTNKTAGSRSSSSRQTPRPPSSSSSSSAPTSSTAPASTAPSSSSSSSSPRATGPTAASSTSAATGSSPDLPLSSYPSTTKTRTPSPSPSTTPSSTWSILQLKPPPAPLRRRLLCCATSGLAWGSSGCVTCWASGSGGSTAWIFTSGCNEVGIIHGAFMTGKKTNIVMKNSSTFVHWTGLRKGELLKNIFGLIILLFFKRHNRV